MRAGSAQQLRYLYINDFITSIILSVGTLWVALWGKRRKNICIFVDSYRR